MNEQLVATLVLTCLTGMHTLSGASSLGISSRAEQISITSIGHTGGMFQPSSESSPLLRRMDTSTAARLRGHEEGSKWRSVYSVQWCWCQRCRCRASQLSSDHDSLPTRSDKRYPTTITYSYFLQICRPRRCVTVVV